MEKNSRLDIGIKIGVTAEWNNSHMNKCEDFHYLKSEKVGTIIERIECDSPPFNPFFRVDYEDGKKGFIYDSEHIRIISSQIEHGCI